MKIGILGFGREGKAVLEFIKKMPKYDFANIFILDQNPKIKIPAELKKRSSSPIRVKAGKNYLKKLDSFDVVFRSPGIPFDLPEIQQAIKKGTIFSSATKLFFENFSGRIIGVTGTKGKGTTSTLLYQILKSSNFDVYLAGNIGLPALTILPQLKQHSIVVLELSSFQLQDLTIAPVVAVVLDIFLDHLDIHKNFKEYLEAKMNITRYQTAGHKVFYWRGNKHAARIAKKGLAKKIYVAVAKSSWFKKGDLKIVGHHNFQNAVMAAKVAEAVGCLKDKIIETIKSFSGLEHRLEWVRSVNGVDFYNDSASTNPQTTMAAIKSFKRPIILIAGGYDKNLDFGPLAKIIRKTTARLAVLFGQNKNKIKIVLKRFPTIICGNLEMAVEAAMKNVQPNDVIIFSPGAASFDMFKDYADRGRQFKEIVGRY